MEVKGHRTIEYTLKKTNMDEQQSNHIDIKDKKSEKNRK